MKTLAALPAALALVGCTTVRYPRLLPLTTNEQARMTCEELQNEIADALKFRASIGPTRETAGAEALGVLGDFGIGNAMERDAARRSADIRIASCNAARREKNCPPTPEEEAEQAARAALQGHPAAGFARWHRANELQGRYHTSFLCAEGSKIPIDARVEGTGPLSICPECRTRLRQSGIE